MELIIKNKLIVNTVIASVALAGLSWLASSGMSRMGEIQDFVFRTTIDSGEANGAANMGSRMYQVIADAVINRNLVQSAKKWAEVKAENQKLMDQVEKSSDSAEEKQQIQIAKTALVTYTELFEKQSLPLLEATPKNQLSDAIRAIDDKIDKQSEVLHESLEKIAAIQKADAIKSDEEFDATRKSTNANEPA